MRTPKNYLLQGLPDGHLEKGGLKQIYEKAGFTYPSIGGIVTSDKVEKLQIDSNIFRPHDIPGNMEEFMDMGVTGMDFLVDYYLRQCKTYGQDPLEDNTYRNEFVELLDFECIPSRLVFLVRKNDFKDPTHWKNVKAHFTEDKKMKPASEYTYIMDYCLQMLDIPHEEVRYFRGKEESFLIPFGSNGYDCVTTVCGTGKSVKENPNLLVVERPVLFSTPRLVVNKRTYEKYATKIDNYVKRLSEAKEELLKEKAEIFADKFDWSICPERGYLEITGGLSLNELMDGLYKINHSSDIKKEIIQPSEPVMPKKYSGLVSGFQTIYNNIRTLSKAIL